MFTLIQKLGESVIFVVKKTLKNSYFCFENVVVFNGLMKYNISKVNIVTFKFMGTAK